MLQGNNKMPDDEIELILLPPEKEREVTEDEIVETYVKLITLLFSGN